MSVDSKIIVDIFSDIVDSLRATGTITNLSVASGVTTVTSENDLSVGEVIEMDDVNYIIRSASSSQFTVNGTGITASTWNALAPYYLFGHPRDISNTLLEKDGQSEPYRYQKYPLIALVQDFNEKKGENILYDGLANLNFIICNITKQEYNSVDRYDNNFRTILYPLYDSFIAAIKSDLNFIVRKGVVKHTKTDNLYLGKTGIYGNIGNIYNDFLDAISIRDMELIIKKNKCTT